MSILVREDREDLVYGMRTALLEQLDNGVLTESASIAGKNFILNEASYNELLNLSFNPDHDVYMESTEVLEEVACDMYDEMLEEAMVEEGLGGGIKKYFGRLTGSAAKKAKAATATAGKKLNSYQKKAIAAGAEGKTTGEHARQLARQTKAKKLKDNLKDFGAKADDLDASIIARNKTRLRTAGTVAGVGGIGGTGYVVDKKVNKRK